jgi:hypothetical protein
MCRQLLQEEGQVMILEVHDHLTKPLAFKATRLLVTFDDGTPAALVVEYGPGHIRCHRVGDKDFNEQLKMAGIDRTVVVDRFKAKIQSNGSSQLERVV